MFILRHVGGIRSNFYVFLFRTPHTVCRNDCNLTFHEQTALNIVMFIKHVYVQYAAESNMKYRLGNLRFCQQRRCCSVQTPSHWCRNVALFCQQRCCSVQTPSHWCSNVALFCQQRCCSVQTPSHWCRNVALFCQQRCCSDQTPSHWCRNVALLEPRNTTLRNQRLGVLARKYWTFRHLLHCEFQPEAIFWILYFKSVTSSTSFRLAKAVWAALTGTVLSVQGNLKYLGL